MYRHDRSAERKWLQQNNWSSAKFKSTLSLSQQNWSIKDRQMVSLLEHRVVMLFCAHITMCTEIFKRLLMFAHSRSLRICWYLPTDLGTSDDIWPEQIFAHPLIFAHSRYSHVCWYMVLDLCASSDIGPQIFARSLIFAQRSSDAFWYLP